MDFLRRGLTSGTIVVRKTHCLGAERKRRIVYENWGSEKYKGLTMKKSARVVGCTYGRLLKKLLAVSLAVLVAVALIPALAFAEKEQGEGDGPSQEVTLTRPDNTFTGWDLPVWAPLNLILAALGLILAGVTAVRALVRKMQEQDEARAVRVNGYRRRRRKTSLSQIWLAATFTAGIAGTIVFIITENTNNLMVMADRWTIVNAVLLAIVIVGMALYYKNETARERRTA